MLFSIQVTGIYFLETGNGAGSGRALYLDIKAHWGHLFVDFICMVELELEKPCLWTFFMKSCKEIIRRSLSFGMYPIHTPNPLHGRPETWRKRRTHFHDFMLNVHSRLQVRESLSFHHLFNFFY